MGKALILVESLAAALLLIATAAAWAARRPGGLRWGVPLAVVAALGGPAAFLVYGMSILVRIGTVSRTSFVVATAWATALLVGSVLILRAARRAGADPAAGGPWPGPPLATAFAVAAGRAGRAARPRQAGRPVGARWPVQPLAVAFAVAAVLTAITVSNLDVAVKGQIAAVRVEAGARALALAQPRSPDGPNATPIYRRAF